MDNHLAEVIAHHKCGELAALYSICSSNPQVLKASMTQASRDGSCLLVESTCNQVDQFGGYSGMKPSQFVAYAYRVAEEMRFPKERLILGGDHLGPSGWQERSSKEAMGLACELVRDYVAAGYSKIHLDASMRCADDPDILPESVVAERAAELCSIAEKTSEELYGSQSDPAYVIGTEVPTPGGAQETLDLLEVTSVAAVEQTIELTRRAFSSRGLEKAWSRVIAIVVQPGVEFGDETVIDYCPQKAQELARLIEKYDRLVYEAHSTDYQTGEALKALVQDHFALLKVGPGLTFALREAVFSLAEIEEQLLPLYRSFESSRVRAVLDQAMLAKPTYWQRHYRGGASRQAFARRYSYSDRSRYYWPDPKVLEALKRLLENLTTMGIPLSLLSQFMPRQYNAVRKGEIEALPEALIRHKIMEVTRVYAAACGCGDVRRVR